MTEDMPNVRRIARLAGLAEARQIDDPDDLERREDERLARERRIEQLIGAAFGRLGIAVAEEGVYYSEDEDRRAEVVLDDNSVAISKLQDLYSSGLSDQFIIEAGLSTARGGLIISFRVSPSLDHAILSRQRK